MTLFNRSGKSTKATPIILFLVLAASVILLSNNTPFSTFNLEPNTWRGYQITGDYGFTDQGGCGYGTASVGELIQLTGGGFASRNTCSQPDGYSNVNIKIPGYTSVLLTLDTTLTASPRDSLDTGSTANSYVSVGRSTTYSERASLTTGKTTISKSNIVVKLQKNNDGKVDSFIKECASCELKYVNTVPYSENIGLSVSAGTNQQDGGGGAATLTLKDISVQTPTQTTPAVTQSCTTTSQCQQLNNRCDSQCNNGRCETVATIQAIVYCDDDTTQIGKYPVCQASQCPATPIDTTRQNNLPTQDTPTVNTTPPLTDASGFIPVFPTGSPDTQQLLIYGGGALALLFVIRLLTG